MHRGVHRGTRHCRSTTATATGSPTPSSTSWSTTSRAGTLDDEIPPHGTLARVRQRTPADKAVGAVDARRRRRRHPRWSRRCDAASMHRRRRVSVRARVLVPDRAEASSRSRFDVRRRLHATTATSRTGGYTALRKALTTMTPEQVHDRGQDNRDAGPRRRRLPGRHQVGLPAARRVPAVPRRQRRRERARHLQGPAADGARSAPADRGLLIACYAVGAAQAFLYVRGEMALAQERIAQALNDAYANGSSARTSSAPTSPSTSCCTWGAGAYIVGEETALIETLEGERGMPRLKPPYFPAAKGLYMQADDRQQRRDARQRAVDHQRIGSVVPRHRRADVDRHADVRRVGPRQRARRVRGAERRHDVPRCCSRRPSTAVASARAATSRRSSPAARARSGSSTSTSTCRSTSRPVDKAGSMLGSGAIIVMDDTTDMVAACWRDRALLRPRELRQVHAVPRGHHVAGADPQADPRRQRPARRPRPRCSRSARRSARASPGRRARRRSARSVRRRSSPIASAVRRFRHEFEHYIEHGRPIDGVLPPPDPRHRRGRSRTDV